MKITLETIQILKNFSTLHNDSILLNNFNGKKVLATRPKNSTAILASAEIAEEFPKVGIFNIPTFLAALSLFENPDLDFQERYVTITDGKKKINYIYADPSVIVSPKTDNLDMEEDYTFTLTDRDINSILKASAILNVPHIAVISDGKSVEVKAYNVENPTSDTFSIHVGESEKTFNYVISTENFKVMDDTYDVTVGRISRVDKPALMFKGNKVTYWFAVKD